MNNHVLAILRIAVYIREKLVTEKYGWLSQMPFSKFAFPFAVDSWSMLSVTLIIITINCFQLKLWITITDSLLGLKLPAIDPMVITQAVLNLLQCHSSRKYFLNFWRPIWILEWIPLLVRKYHWKRFNVLWNFLSKKYHNFHVLNYCFLKNAFFFLHYCLKKHCFLPLKQMGSKKPAKSCYPTQ